MLVPSAIVCTHGHSDHIAGNAEMKRRWPACPIVIGAGSNLQDTVVCHVDRGFPLTVGSGVSVGHGAVLHGCTIGENCTIGAVVLKKIVSFKG